MTVLWFLSIISTGISIWLIAISRFSSNSGDLRTNVESDRYVFLNRRESRIAEWYIAFLVRFSPIAVNLFAYPSHQWIFRIIVTILGILPAITCGFLLFIIGQDVHRALLFFSLASILILLLRFEYLLSRFGQLEMGGGGEEDPIGLYTGSVQLPKKVYVGDSTNVLIRLLPEIQIYSGHESTVTSEEHAKNQIELDIKFPVAINSNDSECLEIGLWATGFQVGGEVEQRQKLNSRELVYAWNCYFPNSGDHAYIARFRKVTGTTKVDIGHLDGRVRVVKIFNLTQNQVYAIAAIFGIPGGLYVSVNGVKLLADIVRSLLGMP